jgi:glycosyltransferase involved in cell wall biosynthesis
MIKKIFIIITKGEVGGAQMSVLNLARGLKEKGLEVKVGFGEGNFLKNELDKAGIDHTRFKYLKRTHNPLFNLFFVWEVKKYFDKNKYDTVHINSSNALFSAIGAKLSKSKPKTIFTFRGMSMLDDNYQKVPILKGLYRLFFKFLLKFIDKPVFVSRENLEKGEKSGLVKKGYLVYNGLDPSVLKFYTRDESKKRLGELLKIDLENKFIIGSIGRLA